MCNDCVIYEQCVRCSVYKWCKIVTKIPNPYAEIRLEIIPVIIWPYFHDSVFMGADVTHHRTRFFPNILLFLHRMCVKILCTNCEIILISKNYCDISSFRPVQMVFSIRLWFLTKYMKWERNTRRYPQHKTVCS